jgi:hypothetical protein
MRIIQLRVDDDLFNRFLKDKIKRGYNSWEMYFIKLYVLNQLNKTGGKKYDK